MQIVDTIENQIISVKRQIRVLELRRDVLQSCIEDIELSMNGMFEFKIPGNALTTYKDHRDYVVKQKRKLKTRLNKLNYIALNTNVLSATSIPEDRSKMQQLTRK